MTTKTKLSWCALSIHLLLGGVVSTHVTYVYIETLNSMIARHLSITEEGELLRVQLYVIHDGSEEEL